MHWTLAPLLGREEKSLLDLLVIGKDAMDFNPLKGATMLAWLIAVVATATLEIIEEAIFFVV